MPSLRVLEAKRAGCSGKLVRCDRMTQVYSCYNPHSETKSLSAFLCGTTTDNTLKCRFRDFRGFPVAPLVENPPAVWKTWVQSLGWEHPLEKGKATHSGILAWRIPWTV